jgi:hypothetical protein
VKDSLENNHESYMSIWSWMVYEGRDFKGDKAFPTMAVMVLCSSSWTITPASSMGSNGIK